MWTLPSTRKIPPARKDFGRRSSWAPSSSGGYGTVRIGAFRPGSIDAIAPMLSARNTANVRNSSDERCWVYNRLAEAGLEEVDGQRPAEVQHDQDREDDPGADDRIAALADAGA